MLSVITIVPRVAKLSGRKVSEVKLALQYSISGVTNIEENKGVITCTVETRQLGFVRATATKHDMRVKVK